MSKGGSSKPKMSVTEYRMAVHMGICQGPVDRVKRIFIGEKVASATPVSGNTGIQISKPDLFGGEKKEGGVKGLIWVLFGGGLQTMLEAHAARLGRTSATAPGFRGVLTMFFTRTNGGFEWGNNTPYLKPVWIEVERVSCEWLDEYAAIPRDGNSAPARDVVVNIGAAAGQNVANNPTTGLSVGVTLTGFVPEQVVTLTLPSGQTYTAWDNGPTFLNSVAIIPDGETGEKFVLGDGGHGSLEAARSAFGTKTISGASQYTFYIEDAGPHGDNSGGLSIRVQAAPVGMFDRNPAHIIYECLTNTNWGMGSPASSLDLDAFEAAAITLFDEQFGLTMVWSQQTEIETFVGEVLDHIEAQLFLHPRTGLLTLKLIRGDYTVAGLPTISPANATLSNFQRKGWGETVNEVIVSFTEHESGKSETVGAHDLASVSIHGIVSDTRNYYGVRRKGFARKLANRDLRAAASPLATCDAEIDRTQWALVPGDVVKLVWPEYGIGQIVMRVGPTDYGAPGNSTIKVSLVEDVFGVDAGDFDAPPDSEWIDPDEAPGAIDHHEFLTIPYWTVVQVLGATGAQAAAHPESGVGVLAAQGGSDTAEYDLATEITGASGATIYEVVATRPVLARMELAAAIAAEAATVLPVAGTTQGAAPEAGGFAFIGAGGDTAVEMALVTAFDDVSMEATLDRGVLDTVPRAWPAATPVWFLNSNQPWHDPTERAAGETASYRILPRTSLGTLDMADAAVLQFTVGERPYLPSRPADVKVNGIGWGIVDSIGTDPVTVTVAERNRLTEDSQVLGWTDATVTPESGQTWKVELLDPADRTVIAAVSGLTGTSTTIAHSVFAGNSAAILRMAAERDGFESLQGHEITAVVVGPTISGTPVETGETGVAYAGFTVSGTGGLLPYSFAVTAGALPPGLALDPATGDVAGMPSLNGTYSGIVITLSDAAGLTDDLAVFTITIGAPAAGAILLSGDQQSGTDRLLLSGDAQSGTDVLTHNDGS